MHTATFNTQGLAEYKHKLLLLKLQLIKYLKLFKFKIKINK